MIASNVTPPALGDDEIHVWRMSWPRGADEPAFDDLLRAYAGADAPAWQRGEHGKPRLPAPWDDLGFNGSHSGNVALFAVGRGDPGFDIGVDLERIRPRPRAVELAERFFDPDEAAWVARLDDEVRLNGFLALWTAKEAVLKAHGGGLSYGLHRASFRIAEGVPVPVAFDGEIAPESAWQVVSLDAGTGFVAALAWRGMARRVRVFTLPAVFTSEL